MRTMCAAAIAAVLAVAGCGGDSGSAGSGSDEDQVRAVATALAQAAIDQDKAAYCELFTEEARVRLGGEECEQSTLFTGVAGGEPPTVELVTVTEDSATAEMSDGTTRNLRKENGEWKVTFGFVEDG